MALGTAALVIASGLADGITRQLSDNLVAIQTGHLQVVVRPRRLPGAEQPVRRVRPGPPAGRRGARASDRGRGQGRRRRARGAVPLRPRQRGRRQPVECRLDRGDRSRARARAACRARGGVGIVPAAGRRAGRLRRRGRRAEAARRRRRRPLLRRPDAAGRGQQPRRDRVRHVPQGRALVRQRLLRDAPRRAAARGLAGRGDEREGAPRRRLAAGPRPGPAVGRGHGGRGRPETAAEGDASPRRELHGGRPLLLGDHPGQPGGAGHALRASSSPRPASASSTRC